MNQVINDSNTATKPDLSMRERFERNAATCIGYICTAGLVIASALLVAQQSWHIYPDPNSALYLMIIIPALVIGIGLSRSGHYRIAACQMPVLQLGFLLHSALTTGNAENVLVAARYAPLAILLVALVLPRRCAIAIAVVEVSAIFLLFRIGRVPTGQMIDALFYNSLFNCIFITTASLRDRYTHKLIKSYEKVAGAARLQEALLQASFDGLAHLDASQRIIEHNAGFASLCGKPGLDLTGKALGELLQSWTAKDQLHSLMDADCFSVGLIHGDGLTRKSLEFTAIRISSCGKVARIVALRDLNHRIESEQLRLEKMEIMRKNQEKTRYLASLSHEIITPLASISGFSEFLFEQADRADLASRQRILSIINQNCHQLRTLLGGVINLSLLEEGVIDIKRQPIVLGEFLEQIIQERRAAADKKGLALQLSINPDIQRVINGIINSDGPRIAQILNNLVGNSVKFTTQGTVKIEARMCLGQVAIDVIDSGPGIAQADQERLFSFGERAATSTKVSGFGLGLYLSKKIAERLGGDLVLHESTLASGCVFRLTLPVSPASPADAGAAMAHGNVSTDHPIASTPSDAVTDRLAGFKILLVEDNEDMRFLTKRSLQANGGDVTIARSGEQAIAMCGRDGVFDVILMDLSMPGMSGLEATQTLRRAGLATPIVAYTAHALDQERTLCLGNGFSDYVIKTSPRHVLIGTIAQYHPASAAIFVE